MSKVEKLLQCNGCKEKLDKLCEALEYNDAEREVAAEVLLWLEVNKLKKKTFNVPSAPDATKPNVMWNADNIIHDLYTVKF